MTTSLSETLVIFNMNIHKCTSICVTDGKEIYERSSLKISINLFQMYVFAMLCHLFIHISTLFVKILIYT